MLEIRIEIYCLLLVATEKPASKIYPNILRTCKEINEEGTSFLYGQNSTTIEISMGKAIEADQISIHLKSRSKGQHSETFDSLWRPRGEIPECYNVIKEYYRSDPMMVHLGIVNFVLHWDNPFPPCAAKENRRLSIVMKWLANLFESQLMCNNSLRKVPMAFHENFDRTSNMPLKFCGWAQEAVASLIKIMPIREGVQVEIDPALAEVEVEKGKVFFGFY